MLSAAQALGAVFLIGVDLASEWHPWVEYEMGDGDDDQPAAFIVLIRGNIATVRQERLLPGGPKLPSHFWAAAVGAMGSGTEA